MINLVRAVAIRATDANDDPVSSAGLHVFLAGTTTAATTYADEDGVTANAHPLVGNADGSFGPAYVAAGEYKIDLRTSAGTSLPGYPVDDVQIGDVVSPEGFATKAAVEAAAIPAAVASLRTKGYTTEGDSGGALYKRVASEPTHAGKITSGDGAFWEIVPELGAVTSKQFGEVGDGVADDTSAIQEMIDFIYYPQGSTAIASTVEGVIVGPNCKTTDTIHAGYGTDFRGGITIRGMGAKRRGEAQNVGTTIEPTFTDRPVFNFQGARRAVLKDIYIDGALDYSSIGTTGAGPTQEATWTAIGGTKRYAPYAAITVDAYSGTEPSGGAGTDTEPYPDVTYPSFLGGVSQYSKGSSSQVLIENVGARNFNTMIAVQPSDISANGDFTQVVRCFVENCVYGVSVGTSQSRNLEVDGLEGLNIYAGIVTNKHGQQIGQLGGPVRNTSFGGFVGRIFELASLSAANSPHFTNCFAEGLHQIGEIVGAGSTDTNLTFDSCNFNFRHSDTNGHPAQVLIGSTRGEITFNGGKVIGFDSVAVFQPLRVTFNNTSVQPDNARAKTYEQIAHNTLSGGVLTETQTPLPQQLQFKPFDVNAGTSVASTPVATDDMYDFTDRQHAGWPLACRIAHRRGKIDNGIGQVERPYLFKSIAKSAFDSVTLGAGTSGRVLTLVDSTFGEVKILDSIANSCIIRDINTDTVWFIRSFDTGTGTIIAEQQNNYISDGASGFDRIEAVSDTSGSLEFIQSLLFTPDTPLKGDTSTSSADLTNLETMAPGGQTTGGASANNELVAGDWFYASINSFTPITSSTNAKIASITSGSNLITMGGNSRDTKTDIVFDYWLRQAPSNEASR